MKKVVLITGASSGIGYATAKLLAQNGYIVYGAARHIEKMDSLKAYGVHPIELDVTDDASAKHAIREIIKKEERIDALYNNAGYGSYGPIEYVSLEEAQKQLDVNLIGVARMCKLVAPIMRSQKSGRIIMTSSVGGKMTTYLGGWYHVSKFGLESLSNSLRQELAPFGIKVSVLEPAGIQTPWGAIAMDHLKDSSKDTPYEEDARKMVEFYHTKETKLMDTPDHVAKVVKRIIETKHPKARYQNNLISKTLVFMSRHCSDHFMDWVVKNTVR